MRRQRLQPNPEHLRQLEEDSKPLLKVQPPIYYQSEVLEKRESKSRENVGIVTVKTSGYNQDGTVVMTYKRTVLVHRREHAPDVLRTSLNDTEGEKA